MLQDFKDDLGEVGTFPTSFLNFPMPLSTNDIESELSYAYIHAVAAAAGMGCKVGGRHDDNHGVDAHITAWLEPEENALVEVDFKIQLKATIAEPQDNEMAFSYRLQGKRRYDSLREAGYSVPHLLAVLFLPRENDEWLGHSADELVLKRCAYWESLVEAPEIATDSVLVWLPKAHVLSPQGLLALARRLAKRDIPRYSHV